jgi:hypothetical protein
MQLNARSKSSDHFEDGNSFFEVTVSINKLSDTSWIGRSRIKRRDTEELVDGFNVFDSSEGGLRKALSSRIQERLMQLGQPLDWGKPDKVNRILNKYLAFQEEEANVFFAVREDRSDTGVAKALTQMRDLCIANAIELTREIATLSDVEKLTLVSASQEEYGTNDDSRLLDVLRAKYFLFEYILCPTPEIIAAHETHRKHLYPQP